MKLEKLIEHFDTAAKKHQGAFTRLMESRSASIIEQNASYETVRDKISNYQHRDSISLLFYNYHLGTLQIWAFSGTKVEFSSIKISRKKLEEMILGFRKNIYTLSDQIKYSAIYRSFKIPGVTCIKETSIEEIKDVLIPNEIFDVIKDSQHILIVPALNIGSFPFAILPVEGNGNKIYIDFFTITVLPSLYDIDAIYVRHNSHSKFSSLVVGNPSFFSTYEIELPNLQGAEKEAKAIARLLKTQPLLTNKASKPKILELIPSAKIIYLATHGVASLENPLDESFIAIAGDTISNSRLSAREIQNLSLQADLVVLSACQTGLGGINEAGITGLARAFKIAGAAEVVVSLWNIDDQFTAIFMLDFMQRYIQQNHKSAAYVLRETMLNMRAKTNDIRLWSGFLVISGKGTIVESVNNQSNSLVNTGEKNEH
jgi:hypothetical protein